MLWLWRFLFGYLTIKIYGENGEQLLNKATSVGIHIWDLRCKKGCITGNVSIKNFIKLRYAKRRIKCKILIENKIGIPFYTQKYKNRIGFVIGLILFYSILITLSNYIWIINVEGNKVLSTTKIIAACNEIGIREGILKKKISSKYDAQRLQLNQEGIAWCSLNIEGSVLTVNLSETAVSDREQRQTPSNIKAAFDGKIKLIDVASGNTIVKVGDTVSKGDLLISGVVQNLSSTLFIHSEGVIIAETKRTFSSEGKYVQTTKHKTGNTVKRYTLDFFNIKIPLFFGNIKQQYRYNSDVKNLKLFNKKIPIKIACERYDILQKITVTYDKAELEEMLYNDIKKQVEKFGFVRFEECEKEVITTDNGILLKITYNCEENIAVQDSILLDTQN